MKALTVFITILIFVFILPLNKSQDTTLQESIKRGQLVYEDFCISCHLPNGKGVANTYPPLAKSDFLKINREASIKAIKYGQTGEIRVNGEIYNGYMAPLGLDDEEIADVMNYITNNWGNKNNKIITEEEVSKIKK